MGAEHRSLAVAALRRGGHRSLTIAALKREGHRSLAVAALKREEHRSLTVAALKREEHRSLTIAALKREEHRSLTISALKRGGHRSLAVAALKGDAFQSRERKRAVGPAIAAVTIALVWASGCAESKQPVTVSAAASLQHALEDIAKEYPHPLALNFGGSGMLAQQIERGAPADVFMPASPKQMDQLAAKGLLLEGTRRDLLRNRIVLVVRKDAAAPGSFRDLAGPAVKLVALGEPASVPAGQYGMEVLRSMGIADALTGRLVYARDVSQVLRYVETGNAEAGILYATDAQLSAKVRVAEVAPDNSHAPVIYPVAVIKKSEHAEAARAFVAYLESASARAIFTRYGFTMANP